MTPEARIFKAQDAKQLIDNPLLIEAFQALEKSLSSAVLMCDPDNKDKAMRIVISQQLLAGIKREITRYIEDGTLAEIQLAEIEQKKSLVARVFRR